MHRWTGLLWMSLVVACGKQPPDAVVVEECTNGSDDDGDGLVDCDDADCADECDSGLTTTGSTTTTIPTYTGTTGVTNPSSPLTLAIDPSILEWQHQVGITECYQSLGRVIVENTSTETAHLIVVSDHYEDKSVFAFQYGTGAQDFFVDTMVMPGEQSALTVFYACNVDHSFGHTVEVYFEHGSDDTQDNSAVIYSRGTIIR